MEIKMINKSNVFILIGIIIFILALSVDIFGLGWWPGYGYKQISGFIVGTIFIIAGLYLKQINSLEAQIKELRHLLIQIPPQLQKKIEEVESHISE
jgi:hypothetical protein